MAEARITYRRDPRLQFPRGSTSILIPTRSHLLAEISNVSAAGLALFVGSDSEIRVGDELPGVTLFLGSCSIRGDLAIRNVAPADDHRICCGCLFFPATPSETEHWMIVVNTVDVVLGKRRCS